MASRFEHHGWAIASLKLVKYSRRGQPIYKTWLHNFGSVQESVEKWAAGLREQGHRDVQVVRATVKRNGRLVENKEAQ